MFNGDIKTIETGTLIIHSNIKQNLKSLKIYLYSFIKFDLFV